MALSTTMLFLRNSSSRLFNISESRFILPSVLSQNILQPQQTRHESSVTRRRSSRPKPWHAQKKIKYFDDKITLENKSFLKELELDSYEVGASPLKDEPWPRESWTPLSRRAGVIARKIGIYPQWTRDGKRVLTTLLQVLDNHVIKFHPSEKYGQTIPGKRYKGFGALVVGANAGSPQDFTKAYCGLFNESGVMPKKKLTRYIITDDARIKPVGSSQNDSLFVNQPGTPLSASHFRAGQYVDVSGTTIDHGFQGVIKRWGMKGGPASHGHTKNHRRMGSIGGGTGRAVILKGKHMPGHMGRERRTIRGLQVLRINYKYNVLWVKGCAVPGHVHHYVSIKDSSLQQHVDKRTDDSLPFPTHFPDDGEVEDEVFADDLFPMNDPTIEYAEDDAKPSK